MEGSIVDSLGTELIGVMSPVSICMLLVVLLVSTLSPPPLPSSPSQTPIVTAANLVYSENPSDSPTQKLEGALLNAAVFVLLIAAVTFVLVLLYYYKFTSFLKHYMCFSAFLILTTMGGAIFLSLIRHFSLPVDAPTCLLFLLNFSILGVVSVFGRGVPNICHYLAWCNQNWFFLAWCKVSRADFNSIWTCGITLSSCDKAQAIRFSLLQF